MVFDGALNEASPERRAIGGAIFVAERTGLPLRVERQCRHAEIGPIWPIRDPAPLAMLPLWGFGGDGD
jgi:hypothetical protein